MPTETTLAGAEGSDALPLCPLRTEAAEMRGTQ